MKIVVQMLELYEQSMERLNLQSGGNLSIGTIDSLASYYLPPLIQKLRDKYPKLSIRLHPDREPHIIYKVKEGDFDMGFMLENEPSDMTLKWTPIREEPLVVIANSAHPLTKLSEVELSDLDGMEWIMTEETCNYRMMLEKVLRSNGISYRIGLELGNPEAIKRCVMAGSGISLMPQMAVIEEIRRGELAVLPFTHPDIRLNLQMVMHPKKWLSHAISEFMDMLK
jgi:DNA-binding transcriptional LysR family regulator